MSGFAVGLEPLRRYADFTGRSTRSELLFFYVLSLSVSLAIGWASFALDFAASRWISIALTLALLSPWTALAVRRLHDSGRSGWWLLPALPSLCAGLWNAYSFAWDPVAQPAASFLPPVLSLLFGAGSLAVVVLLFWNDQEAANRYGPNPRHGAREAAA